MDCGGLTLYDWPLKSPSNSYFSFLETDRDVSSGKELEMGPRIGASLLLDGSETFFRRELNSDW